MPREMKLPMAPPRLKMTQKRAIPDWRPWVFLVFGSDHGETRGETRTATLLVRERITEHDRALGDPEEGGAETEDSARGDHKGTVVGPVVVEEGTRVHGVWDLSWVLFSTPRQLISTYRSNRLNVSSAMRL
jgi:hypothetical protein